MKKTIFITTISFVFFSCVSQKKYQELETNKLNAAAKSQNRQPRSKREQGNRSKSKKQAVPLDHE